MDTEALFEQAIAAARNSPNRVRKVGAVLVPQDGQGALLAWNDFPHGVRATEERHQGDGRLIWMEHAERNAIYAAARTGRASAGAHLCASFFPCLECARAIAQAGVRHLHTLPPAYADPVWGASFAHSLVVLQEAGVQLHFSARDPQQVHAATMLPP